MLRTLDDGWTVRAVGGPVPDAIRDRAFPARVPGCVHLDLLAAGAISDPYLDENEATLAWIGEVDWRYETQFDDPGADDPGADHAVDLVALGLDTVATVEVNHTVVARTANMHRSHRIRLGELRPRNLLAVTFAAPVPAARSAAEELGDRPYVSAYPFNAIRKMAANYGWDWGPALVTSGIWRPIGLDVWHTARLAAVRPLVDVLDGTGRLTVHVDIEGADDTPLELLVRVGDRTASAPVPAGATHGELAVDVPDVELWWPRGYGEQPLYPVEVTLRGTGPTLDTWHGRVGFRTVAVDTGRDDVGTAFTIVVNGRPVFARGVNWIPEDCFPSRVDRDRYQRRLTQAWDAGVNLVRVWGGGIYESDDFYDVCDELGLLVWQDFTLACAAYAEEEPLRAEIVAEAREAVTRLCPHPSLALWNGGNENIWGHADWGWAESLDDRTWGWGYYTEIFPAIVAELDPTRPYTPGCPYSFDADGDTVHPNDPDHGTMHIWDVWNALDYTAYRNQVPRFVSEFGFQGPPTWATLTRAVHDDPLRPDSPGMLAHQKAEEGQDKLARGLKGHFPAPEGIDDWHWATSLNQARAITFGVEHLRSWSPRCMGAVVWQLNDCWPVTSWSAVDGDGRRKPMWYALRRSFRDRLLTVQPRDGAPAVVAVNDTDEPWRAAARAVRLGYDGTTLAAADLALDVAPRATVCIPLPPEVAHAADPSAEVLVVDGAGERASWFFAEDVDAALAAADSSGLHVRATAMPGGYRVTVQAGVLLRDVAVLADRLAPDAEVDDMLVTLLPGESATFEVRTAARLDPAAFTDARVVRCANRLVHVDHSTSARCQT